MKCPKCEKPNKPGVKNCEHCNELMPVRKKRVSSTKKTVTKTKIDSEKKSEKVKTTKKVTSTKTEKKIPVKKENGVTKKSKVIEVSVEEKKEPIIELSDEKKAVKKMLKNIKKVNKIIYFYILLVIVVLVMILFINKKMHTITCEVNNNSETEKYNIKLVINKDDNNITGFKYITKNTTNSYDETLKARYDIIVEELSKKNDFEKIVKSNLKSRNWIISYEFTKDKLNRTNDFIGIDLTPYLDDVNSFVQELEQSVGFTCK